MSSHRVVRAWALTRAAGVGINPTAVTQRANQFATKAGGFDSAVLLLRREAETMRGYLLTSGAEGDSLRAAKDLAHTVGARAEEVEVPQDLELDNTVGWLVYESGSSVARDPQVNTDPAETARLLANTIPPGSWVAVVLRRPTKKERTRNQKWLAHRLSTSVPNHHSLSPDAVVVSVFAGGADARSVRSVLEATRSAMPGFDVITRTRVASRLSTLWPWLPAGLASVVAGVGSTSWPWLPDVTGPGLLIPGVAVGTAAVLVGVLRFVGAFPSAWRTAMAMAASCSFAPPRRRRGRPRPPRAAVTSGDKQRSARTGDYPLHPASFLVGPQVVVGVVAPQAGAVSGESETRSRDVPPVLLERIGPFVGESSQGPAYLSAGDAFGGCAIVGKAGSGKLQPLTARFPVPVSEKFPEGWATNAELEVGDEVFSADGSVTRVRGFSPVRTVRTYEVEFDDGQVVEAGADHLWKVSTRYSRAYEAPDTSTVAAGFAERDERRLARAQRLRELGDSFAAGVHATAVDLSNLAGCDVNTVHTIAREAGLELLMDEVEVRPAGKIANHTRQTLFAADAVRAELRRVAADRRSTLDGAMRTRVDALEGDWWSTRQIADALYDGHATDVEMASTRVRLRQVSERRKVQVARLVDAKPLVRRVRTFPVSEFLRACADRVAAGGHAPVESLLTTEQMKRQVRVGTKRAANFAVRLAAPVDGPGVRLPVDPYLLGYWLGDGHSDAAMLTVGGEDIDQVRDLLAGTGFCISEKPSAVADHDVRYLSLGRPAPGACKRGHPYPDGGRACTVCPTTPHRRNPDPVINASCGELLVELGVRGSKHIPALYRRASAAQRLALLQGVMDSDGTIDANGSCELSLTDRRLATDVVELTRSLGIKVSVSWDAPAGYVDASGVRIECVRHRIHFTTTQPVFRLGRKAGRLPGSTRPTQRWLYVTDIRASELTEMRCIAVEHPSGMYLTDGFVPTHNTQLTRSLFGWACVERQRPSGLPGFPGASNTLIAFESKGSGVPDYLAWAEATGDNVKVVDVADPSSLGIDLFAVPGSYTDRAGFFVNALIYAFGETAVGDRSFETLMALFPAALAVTPEMAARVPGVSPDGSPVYFTHVLLGGRGDKTGEELAAELNHESVREGADPQLVDAVAGMGALYGATVTQAQRRGLQEAPRNKLRQLIELEEWWTPNRRKVTWDTILERHRAVVINTGTSLTTGAVIEDKLNGQISAILMYSLRAAIKRVCPTWEDDGRAVSIYADELSLLAGSSDTVIAWLKDQGRSWGVRTFFATQRPEQLPDKARKAVMNFSTLVSFIQEDIGTAREIAEAVSAGDDEWTASDILQLNTYSAIVRTHVGKRRMPAFTVKVPNFEGDRPGFARVQGYADAPVPVEAPAPPPVPTPPPAVLEPDPDPVEDDAPDLMSW